MEAQTKQHDESEIRLLYQNLLESWNNHNPETFASLFASDGITIGFDGSQMNGRQQINDELGQIFANHTVSSYVGIIREIRALCSTVFLLRAVAGMVAPGKSEINQEVNTIQTLIARKEQEEFRIILYHNTPAAFHGRPELAQQLTGELQQVVNNQQTMG